MRLSALVLLLLAAGCAHAPLRQEVVVVAEGWGPSAAGALADAQRKAVERVVGLALRAHTMVDRSVAVEQKVWADVAGRIAAYEVLSEAEEGGLHKTRIRATVRKGELDASELKPLPLPGDPTVAVVVDTRSFPDRAAAERGLRQALLDAGVSLGFGRADFLVSGEASAAALDSGGLEGFASCGARLEVELREPGSGRLLAARSFEASAIGLSRQAAAAKALEQAGRLAGERLAADLRAALSQR